MIHYRHLPNLITCGNLVCGLLALGFSFSGQWSVAIQLVLVAAVLDVADGAVARILKVTSSIGKDLDSLADVVSFGCVPAVWAMGLMTNLDASQLLSPGVHWMGLLIAPSSALRLANFNHDTRQTTGFIGLPTPANTLMWMGLVYLYMDYGPMGLGPVVYKLILTACITVSAWLLHAPIALLGFKFEAGGFAVNKWRYALVAWAAVCTISLGHSGLVPAMVGYLSISFLANINK